MIPILYEKGETAFTSNGQCRLVDCLSCLVTEERNGIYECEFSYPVTGRGYSKITLGSIIYTTHDDTRTPQPFDIYKRTASIDGVVTFYARHIAYRLSNVILKPFAASSCAQTIGALAANSLTANPFTFWTDKQATGDFHLTYPRSVWDILGGSAGSILDVYGKGTYEFDQFTVKLHLNRGRQTDVSIRYGKNLTELEHTRDTDGLHNCVVPFWCSSEGDTVVTVPGWFVTAPGTYLVEYLTTEGLDVVVDENSVPIEVHTKTGDTVSVMDLSEAFEEEPTVEQLRQKALSRLTNNKSWEPDENLSVNFTQLWQTAEYENVAALQRVSLCDTVSVVFPEIGLTAERVQIIKVVYDSLLDRYDSMELGQPSVTLAGLIKQDVERSILGQVPSNSDMAQAIDAATQLITGGSGGHVVIATDANGKPNEILIMDTDNINTAVKVLRINMNGIGFSRTGYQGPFTTAWTLNGGFVANFITSGTLRANLIKAGVLSDEAGRNYWNMETGEFSLWSYPTKTEARQYAASAADNAVDCQTQADIFNKLTNNGAAHGIFMNNGELFINASYINTGFLDADCIRASSITGDKIAANTITASKIDIASLFAQDITSTGTFQIDTDEYKQYASQEEDGFVFWSGNEQAHTGCEMHLRRNGNFSLWASDELYVFSDDTFYIDSHGGDGVKINENEPSATLEVWGESTFRADVGIRGDLSVGGDTVCSGDLSVTGAISEGGTLLSSRYSRQLAVFDTTIALSIPAGDAVNLSASVSQAGYTPIAVAGFRFTDTNSSRVMIFKSHLSGTNYHYGARNTNDVDFSGNLVVNILYVSN